MNYSPLDAILKDHRLQLQKDEAFLQRLKEVCLFFGVSIDVYPLPCDAGMSTWAWKIGDLCSENPEYNLGGFAYKGDCILSCFKTIQANLQDCFLNNEEEE